MSTRSIFLWSSLLFLHNILLIWLIMDFSMESTLSTGGFVSHVRNIQWTRCWTNWLHRFGHWLLEFSISRCGRNNNRFECKKLLSNVPCITEIISICLMDVLRFDILGVIWGFLTGLVTKFTENVRVIEPIFIFIMAYLAYLNAEMLHLSGILS